jgi:MFS family permease
VATASYSSYNAPPEINRVQLPALLIGVVASVLLIIGIFVPPQFGGGLAQFFHSYLIGYIFWTGIALGCLAILMLQYVANGAWGLMSRRVLESGSRTIPLMLILFMPVILGLHQLYEWTDKARVESDEVLVQKEPYLNIPFFIGRTLIYFLAWLALMYFLNKWSGEQDRTADITLAGKTRKLSGPGIVAFILTVTFASVDWVMSLDPHWFSTIFGLIFTVSWALSALSFVIVVMMLLTMREPMNHAVTAKHFHDLGKLLLALVMLWAYLSFSQFLIIWSGNIPEETKWYLHRLKGGWEFIGLAIALLHFALPFLLLLSRSLKRDPRKLAAVAVFMLLMRLVDLFWLIAPEYGSGKDLPYGHFHISWMDVVAPIGIGGLWLWWFAWQLKKRPLLPYNDPKLESALEHGRHGGH